MPAQVTLRWHVQRGDIVFPKSVTESRVRENFALFDDWEDRYRYLIDLGRKLPDFPEAPRSAHPQIHPTRIPP